MKNIVLAIVGLFATSVVFGQNVNKFKQLKEELATPNVYRTASGAPGHQYYQQKADYQMSITLNDTNQTIAGEETITYTNNSPDELSYLWLQLDQNMRAKDSDTKLISSGDIGSFSYKGSLQRHLDNANFDGGFKISSVKDGSGEELSYTINNTMMRVDLPQVLKPKAKRSLKIKWSYKINNRMEIGGRSGLEYFEEEDNYLYTIAQFFPRMCVYNDVEGWQNKQFLGNGEFTLPFGDYIVDLTVPSDHIVSATGILANAKKVLTSEQNSRLEAVSEDAPSFIVTPEEAEETEKSKVSGTKTWRFVAKNVRDFAFASSRKFIWDAQLVKQDSRDVLAMSFYPKEGNPLWERYSTRVIVQTLKTYSKHTFDYPYPVAISVHTNRIGMEYPMICFNGGRPNADGTYSERTKYGMHSVIIHEVGHNYFPMIINSDERQWTWMDEGLNTFLQFLTEQEWQRDYPSRRGPAHLIVDYMKGDKSNIAPIMTNSESLLQFGNNAYGKPATALNILRETVMGRELFDFAFKTYAQRWMFKHPTPADFFRTMEDASAVDLDWFWRGWFMTTDHVDIALNNVSHFQINSMNEEKEVAFNEKNGQSAPENISTIRNRESIKETENERTPSLNDKYIGQDPNALSEREKMMNNKMLESLTEKEKALLDKGFEFYQLDFENLGGLVMPIVLEFSFEDKSKEVIRIPAEIWKRNNFKVSKVFIFEKVVKSVQLDPFIETADVDTGNNSWPAQIMPSRFSIFKEYKYGY